VGQDEASDKARLGWQKVLNSDNTLWRHPVPGGWLYAIAYPNETLGSMTFVPDANRAQTLKPVPDDPGWQIGSGVPGDDYRLYTDEEIEK
jgi:hypothetical protein